MLEADAPDPEGTVSFPTPATPAPEEELPLVLDPGGAAPPEKPFGNKNAQAELAVRKQIKAFCFGNLSSKRPKLAGPAKHKRERVGKLSG